MSNAISLEQFSDRNIADYEMLTGKGDDGKICYCSFWHGKWGSIEAYDNVKRTNPEQLKACVIDRMRSNFHVGVLAYVKEKPCAWVSVGPIIDFYWAWRRVGQLGDEAKNTAGIMCFTVADEFRGQKMQVKVTEALKQYGKEKGWKRIEAYPFSYHAIQKHGKALLWPGLTENYEKSGFSKLQDHWLSSPEAERFIYKHDL